MTLLKLGGVVLSKRVLIVDDNANIRKGVMAIFGTDHVFEICGEAVDGRDAIEKAKSLKPDLIVLDFSMPVMNGIEAACVLTLIMPDVPLILLTMHLGKIVEVDAQKAGFRAIFSKDQNLELLVSRARALLGLPLRRTKSGEFKHVLLQREEGVSSVPNFLPLCMPVIARCKRL